MITEFEEQLLEQIDNAVETASDDELFAGGYLRGHISLSAAACEAAGEDDIQELKARIELSLEAAKGELSPADRAVVSALWNTLQQDL
ncbi:hypothetical protein CSW98_14600 [Vibrio sp. HA2012]|uniref:YfcL family protein n=1 Tax=Vibrio sp. HA2012 TaxID=1971595 RepID=UPI000C2B7121|nr:YfcL family protein [Vibrio sp. HA2012]PJC85418.1 hypothetical protein CSW98_14600 [Vibrio sp. HA2012]